MCVGVVRFKVQMAGRMLKDLLGELKLGLRKLWGSDWLRVRDVKQSPPGQVFTLQQQHQQHVSSHIH